MRRDILIFALLLLSLSVPLDVSIAQQWRFYTTEDGLVGESIWSIQEDARGYLWFMTAFSGTSRYDGVRFQNLDESNGLVSNNIYFTLSDEAGNFWLATDRGVSRYDGRDFRNFDESNGLVNNNVTYILEDNGNFWFGTANGVSTYDGERFRNFDEDDGLIDNNVTVIFKDEDDNLWFGTGKGVSKYDGKRFVPVGGPSEKIEEIFEDKDGNLWFGTERNVYRKDVRSPTIGGRPLLGSEANVRDILEDQSGNLWFATANQGVIRCDHQGKDFHDFTSQNGLIDNCILSMQEDSRGDLWFGTDKGISRYDGQDFESFTEIDSIDLRFARDILKDSDENLWFGTENGVCRYTMQDLQMLTEEDGLADNSVRDKAILEDRDGYLWFGTRKGASRYDGGTFHNFGVRDGLADDSILSILQDSMGVLWFGTGSGVSRYNGTDFEPLIGEKAPTNVAVRVILEDKTTKDLWFATEDGVIRYDRATFEFWAIENGREMFMDSSGNLWLGTLNNGLHKYDGESWEQYTKQKHGLGSKQIGWILEDHDGNIWFELEGDGVCRYDGADFTNFTTATLLLSDLVRDACVDNKGRLWFATDRGVMKCGNPSLALPHFEPIHGSISDNVSSILSDTGGNIWFGTDEGIGMYDGENFQNNPLDLTDTVRRIYEDSKRAMWFATTRDGVSKYTPTSSDVHPRIHITQIEADEIYRNVDSIRVSSTTKRITFEYKGISFGSRPDEMRYTYQLEGYDLTWLSTNDIRVHYENLKPEHYQFRVCAIDRDFHQSVPPAIVDIEVFRPFYLTPQFIVSVVLGGICLLGGGSYLSVQLGRQRRTATQLRERLRKQEEAERIQTAMMNSLRHLVAGILHGMGNPISVIRSSNDIFGRTVDKINSLLTQGHPQEPERNRQLMRMLTGLKNTSQASRTASERIQSVVKNLQNFVDLDKAEWQIIDIHKGIDNAVALLELEVTKDYGDFPRIRCSPESLNWVFLGVLRNASEAIEEGGEIRVRTATQKGYVKIEISDTGRGIPPENLDKIFDLGFTTKSMGVGMALGLSTCHNIIVDKHRGRIDVSSEVGVGTTFTIWLPFSQEE